MLPGIGPAEVILMLGVAVVVVAVPLYAVIDATRRPAEQFMLRGRGKRVWVVVLALAVVVPLGFLVSAWYLLGVRPQFQPAL